VEKGEKGRSSTRLLSRTKRRCFCGLKIRGTVRLSGEMLPTQRKRASKEKYNTWGGASESDSNHGRNKKKDLSQKEKPGGFPKEFP